MSNKITITEEMISYAASEFGCTKAEFTALFVTRNYDRRASQIEDNFSNAGVPELVKATGFNSKGVSALIGSLESKKLAFFDYEYKCLYMTKEGINVLYSVLEKFAK